MSAFHWLALLRKIRFNRTTFDRFGAPRRPRNPMLRIAVGLVGAALLLALLFVSVFVGVAMLATGMLFRIWKQRGRPLARATRDNPIDGRALDGKFRVVGKAQLPLVR